MQQKTKTIYTKRLAYELRKKGFKILYTEPNQKNPFYDNYIFLWTPDIEQAIEELK